MPSCSCTNRAPAPATIAKSVDSAKPGALLIHLRGGQRKRRRHRRRPSRDTQRHAQNRVTPNVPPLFPKFYPRAFKCCPRAALPQMFPHFTPNDYPRAVLPLPQMLPRAVLQMLSQSQSTAWKRWRRLGRWPACWRATRDAGRRNGDDDWSDDSPN